MSIGKLHNFQNRKLKYCLKVTKVKKKSNNVGQNITRLVSFFALY